MTTLPEIVKNVEDRILALQKSGGIVFPPDFAPGNALRAAQLILPEVKDKNKRPALEICTKSSIYSALLKMVVFGLNPMKNQCAFVVMGDKLELMKQYGGNLLLARRAGLKTFRVKLIYEKDHITIEQDHQGHTVVKHTTSFENIDDEKIIGGYVYYELENGEFDTLVMPMKEIRKAWLQGKIYGQITNSVHEKFTGEMVKKTIINRMCKYIINSSSDIYNVSFEPTVEDSEDLPAEQQLEVTEDKPLEVIQLPVEEQEKPEENGQQTSIPF